MARSFLILLVVLSIGSSGCYTQIAHKTDSSEAEQGDAVSRVIPDDGLELELRSQPLIMKRGETLLLELTLTNTSSETVTRGSPNGCLYGFSILNPDGKRVAPEPRLHSQRPATVSFAPGEVVVINMEWKSKRRGIRPGKYFVHAGFGEDGMADSAPPVEFELR
jgi:hypothetical protein